MRAALLFSSGPIFRYFKEYIRSNQRVQDLFSNQGYLNEEAATSSNNHRPIIAFDLDNTLVSTTRIKTSQTNFTIYAFRDNLLSMKNMSYLTKGSTLPINIKKENLDMDSQKKLSRSRCSIHVQIRPGAINFIKEVSKIYEIFFFTSYLREVAIEIIKIISPEVNEDHILSKESCIFIDGYAVKDLTKLMDITGPIEMTKVLLVDDVLGSGLFQPLNIVGVSSWEGETDDEVLEKDLLPLLIECGQYSNVVNALRNRENGLPLSLTIYNY